MSPISKQPHFLLALVLLLASCSAPSNESPTEVSVGTTENDLIANITYGVSCQDDYQNGYQKTLGNMMNLCSNFITSMDGGASRAYYTNLHNTEPYYEETAYDNLLLESVDIHFNGSHGGAGPELGWQLSDGAVFAMWDEWSLARSPKMRLGNEARGLSVLASLACDQLLNDADVWTRWASIMRGGLRIALAANGLMSDQPSAGKRFADNLKAGQTFWSAWYNGTVAADATNKPAVMVAGVSNADCWNRLNGMKLSNFKSAAYPVLRDNALKNFCMVYTN